MNSDYLNRSSYNLRGTKERLLEINPNYFLEKEIETPKEIRILASRNLGDKILFVDIGAFFLILLLMLTFCLSKNECCTADENVRANCIGGTCCACCLCHNGSDCDCECDLNFSNMNFTGRGGGVYGAIISLFVLLVIALIFLLIKVFIECGKHRDRVFIFMVLFFLNIILYFNSSFFFYCCCL